MRFDGSNLLGLRFFPPAEQPLTSYPTTSANGSTIAFLADRDSLAGQRTPIPNLWISNNLGSGTTVVSGVASEPTSLSGDGSLVAYAKGGQIHIYPGEWWKRARDNQLPAVARARPCHQRRRFRCRLSRRAEELWLRRDLSHEYRRKQSTSRLRATHLSSFWDPAGH